jgi:hypothetical protein
MKINRIYGISFLAAFAAALSFALYTQHAWEDWYITYRASKNLATGVGLLYNAGERVHSFTSVLGTLIPAFLNLITFNQSDDLVLWLFRIVNSVVLGCSAVLLVKIARKWFSFVPSMVVLAGVFILDTKTLDFTINGMESVYVVFSLSLFLYLISFHPVRELKVKLGIVWALLEYSRPDGIVYAFILALGMLLFLKEKKEVLKTVVISGLLGALLFSPWFIFTLFYYGNPVPHSIIAKSLLTTYGFGDLTARTYAYLTSYLFLRYSILDLIFSPPNSSLFNMPELIQIGKYIAIVSSLVWLVPRVKPVGRIASFTFFCLLIYLSVFPPIIVSAWYLPGPTLLALVGFSFLLDYLLLGLVKIRPQQAMFWGWSVCGVFLAYMLILTLISAHQFRLMEAINERGNREQIGLWLKANSRSNRETVFVECAGYIGFYSGLKLYDFPGMTSKEMVQARKILHTEDWLLLIKYLKPDWLVLRPGELSGLWQEDSPFLMTEYEFKKHFDVRDQIYQIGFRPYDAYFLIDADFSVFKKR